MIMPMYLHWGQIDVDFTVSTSRSRPAQAVVTAPAGRAVRAPLVGRALTKQLSSRGRINTPVGRGGAG